MEEVATNNAIRVIHQVDTMINNHVESINKLLKKDKLKGICNEYEQLKNDQTNIGFNIFPIISDSYKRETFHSDIIHTFLNKQENHKAGDKYLIEFIKLLEKAPKEKSFKSEINVNDFLNSTALKEVSNGESKIDILIKDEKSLKAIIVENKINNAPDMERQLPRYYDFVTNMKYKVVALVYLTKDGYKSPNENGWKEGDNEKVYPQLIKLPAYNETQYDLFSGWLQPSINITNDIDALCILRQYKKLIQTLKTDVMNEKLMEDFYNKVLKEDDNFKTALSLKDLIENIPQYFAQRIVREFEGEPSPFNACTREDNSAVFRVWKFKDSSLRVKIICEIDKYQFRFWDENCGENGLKFPEEVVKELGKEFEEIKVEENDKDAMGKFFRFNNEMKNFSNAEQNLFDFIRKFKKQLILLKNKSV